VPGPLAARYYAQRASAGLIVTEATQVTPGGQGYIATPGIHDLAQAAGWRRVTDAVHAAGGRIFLQLWHVGRVSHQLFQPDGGLPVSASAVPLEGGAWTYDGMKPHPTPRALATAEVAEVVAQFRRGAELAKAAELDGATLATAPCMDGPRSARVFRGEPRQIGANCSRVSGLGRPMAAGLDG
jgi:N-ethylmaleimide reductase